jgi:hypothetical protein
MTATKWCCTPDRRIAPRPSPSSRLVPQELRWAISLPFEIAGQVVVFE